MNLDQPCPYNVVSERVMSAQSLFSSVFSCSPSSKTISKRRLRQTRSLDPALMRHYGTDAENTTDKGNFTWNSTSGRSVGLKPVPLQSLSELERVRLQDVVFRRLLQDFDLGCQFTVPKDGQKRKMSLRRKFDSLSKEKSKDKDALPQAFGIPLSQAISNDRMHKQRHEPAQHGEQQWRDPSEPPTLHFLHLKTTGKDVSSSNSSLSSTSETPTEAPPLSFEAVPRTHRRGGVSVDCITDLDDNQSRLLEALQLSVETPSNRKKHCNKKLSLNPIYRQVPRVVDSCCQHLEKYGLNTVGIFRIGSSKKRVRQLREEFDQGMEVQLDAEHSVHDVAALLKVFLRDMPDPLLTRELYTAFINTMLLEDSDQENAIQLLMYILPPCNSDTLQRLLQFLYTVAAHSEDGVDCGGREITGNKMTALNLATIFGPNLLHKLKNSDKEFAVQSFARAEESTAIISVVQRMITAYDTLFMVPADLQNEVLISLLETDPDVVDYLLRRKASQHSDSDPVETDTSFSQSDRRLSSDSNKASSGEVSPYDNSSPVLSERLYQGGSSPSDSHFRPVEGSSEDGLTHYTEAPDENFWGGWDDLLRTNLLALQITGFHGDAWECESCESLEGLDSCQGNSKQPSRLWQSSLGVAACRPRPPVTHCRSSPYDQRGQRQPSPQTFHSQSGATSSEDIGGRTLRPGDSASSPLKGGLLDLVGDPRISHSSPTLFTYRTGNPPSAKAPQRDPKSGCPDPQPANSTSVFNTPEAGKDKWHIWQLLSTDNADALPETLV